MIITNFVLIVVVETIFVVGGAVINVNYALVVFSIIITPTSNTV